MDWTIEFCGDGVVQDATIVARGVATREGFRMFNEELVYDERWRPGMAVLVDCSELEVGSLNNTDVEAIGEHLVSLDRRIGPAISAIVAPDAYTAGLVGVSVRHAAPAQLVAQTFASREDALDWLRDEKHGRDA